MTHYGAFSLTIHGPEIFSSPSPNLHLHQGRRLRRASLLFTPQALKRKKRTTPFDAVRFSICGNP